MDDSEPCRARLMTVNVDESPACVEVDTSRDRQLQIDPRGPFRLDLTAWALRRRSHNAVDRWNTGTYERVVSLDGAPKQSRPTETRDRPPSRKTRCARYDGSRPMDDSEQ